MSAPRKRRAAPSGDDQLEEIKRPAAAFEAEMPRRRALAAKVKKIKEVTAAGTKRPKGGDGNRASTRPILSVELRKVSASETSETRMCEARRSPAPRRLLQVEPAEPPAEHAGVHGGDQDHTRVSSHWRIAPAVISAVERLALIWLRIQRPPPSGSIAHARFALN